jgi:hypothetical protein
MKIIAVFLSLTAIMIIIYGIGSLQCSVQDKQTATSNTFTAFSSTVWTQTTRADFELGVLFQVDTARSPGDVQLAVQSGQNRFSTGNLASQVLNTGMKGLKLDVLAWTTTLSPQTSLSLNVRASDWPFTANNNTLPWIALGSTSPVSVGLPRGQYVQWRADFSTTDKHLSPVLQSVEVWYH